MLANFFVLWLLLAVGGGFLLFFGGLLASWIGEEMVSRRSERPCRRT